MRTVRCTTSDCPSRGLVRTVPDRRAGPGVVYRPDLYCADCGFALPDVAAHNPVVETTTRNPPETAARTGRSSKTAAKRRA